MKSVRAVQGVNKPRHHATGRGARRSTSSRVHRKDVVHLRGPDVARVRWATPDVGGNILVHGELSNGYFLAKFGLDTEENEAYKVYSFG